MIEDIQKHQCKDANKKSHVVHFPQNRSQSFRVFRLVCGVSTIAHAVRKISQVRNIQSEKPALDSKTIFFLNMNFCVHFPNLILNLITLFVTFFPVQYHDGVNMRFSAFESKLRLIFPFCLNSTAGMYGRLNHFLALIS